MKLVKQQDISDSAQNVSNLSINPFQSSVTFLYSGVKQCDTGLKWIKLVNKFKITLLKCFFLTRKEEYNETFEQILDLYFTEFEESRQEIPVVKNLTVLHSVAEGKQEYRCAEFFQIVSLYFPLELYVFSIAIDFKI